MRAIITFHSIDRSGSILSYSPGMFEGLLKALAKSNIPVCDLDSLLSRDGQQSVSITFDDGVRSVFTSALPIIKDFAVPVHLFLTTGSVGKSNRWPSQPAKAPQFEMLSWNEIESLRSEGFLIESHTANHPDLRKLSAQELALECQSADDIIEKRLGRRPRYFAYPYGYYNSRVKTYTGNVYEACMTTELRPLNRGDDRAMLPRLDSYYLRNPWLFKRLDSALSRSYITIRSFLRKLKGNG